MEKYKLINGWTKEKVMEQVKKYNNGQPALSATGMACVYRDLSGNRCAVGCFIPDGHPALTLPVPTAAKTLLSYYPELTGYMPFSASDLGHFQHVHDDAIHNVYTHIQKFLDEQVEE